MSNCRRNGMNPAISAKETTPVKKKQTELLLVATQILACSYDITIGFNDVILNL